MSRVPPVPISGLWPHDADNLPTMYRELYNPSTDDFEPNPYYNGESTVNDMAIAAVDVTAQTDIETEVKKLDLVEISAKLKAAREKLAEAQTNYDVAGKAVKAAVEAERAAYKEFNDAVKEMRPKRTPRAKKEEEAKPEAKKTAEKKKK